MARLDSNGSTAMMGYAPTTLAAMIADMPTGPHPRTATDDPGVTLSEFRIAPAPVWAPHPRGAATSDDKKSGILRQLDGEQMAYSANELCLKKQAAHVCEMRGMTRAHQYALQGNCEL
jgi:hypothetical protein